MKFVLSIALVSIAALMLAACGANTSSAATPTSSSPSAREIWVAVDPVALTRGCSMGLYIPAEGMGSCETIIVECKLSAVTGQELPARCLGKALEFAIRMNNNK